MAFKAADRIKEQTSTTGTGTLSLGGAENSFVTFVSGIGTGNTCNYCILDGNGTDFEVGTGTVTSGSPNTLSRTTVYSSTNSGSKINLSASTPHVVFCAAPAGHLLQFIDELNNWFGTGVSTFLITPSSANLKAAVTDETGSGALVFATSPTLVTPVLGTPSSGTLTSCTGLPIGSGVSGLGTGVAAFLATPTSANLAAAITDETGSGANVFATSPTLVTPVLGAATGTSVALGGTIPTQSGNSGGVLSATTTSVAALSISYFANNTSGVLQLVGKSRGTISAAAAVQTGDVLYELRGHADDGSTNGSLINAGRIRLTANGTISTAIVPTQWEFATMNVSGGIGNRMILTPPGGLVLGTTTEPGAGNLLVNGTIAANSSMSATSLALSSTSTNALLVGGTSAPIFGTTTGRMNFTGSSAFVGFSNFAASAVSPNIFIGKSRGTISAAAAVQNNDDLGVITFYGDDGSTNGTIGVRAAIIETFVSGTVSAGIVPTAMSFAVMNSSGTRNYALYISPSSGVSIGGTSADAGAGNLLVNGTATFKVYTVSTLPTVGTAGRRAAVTDASATTFASIVAGSGSNKVPVYDNGTNWIIA